ncbi:hypothetical protein M8J77_013016 [Diaphorina citri]|nr:hypothetical protein M8J77_013016 [Diaphorina citri]
MTSSPYTAPFANCSLSSSPSQSDLSDADDVISSNDLLKERLEPFSGKLTLCHLNFHSLRSTTKFEEFTRLFDASGLDVICITESWLDPSIPDSEVSLPGYRVVRNDRQGKSGGGVAIYFNNSFTFKVLESSSPVYNEAPEYIIMELVINTCPILLAVVYHPPRAGDLSQFEDSLELVLPHYSHRLICGDFNVDLLTSSPKSISLKSMFSTLNLNILPLQPTHCTRTSSSLLDLLIVGDLQDVLSFGQLPVGCSDHDLIYLAYSLFPTKHKDRVITSRNFKKFNSSQFLHDACAANWDQIYSLENIDDKLSCFNDLVLTLFNKHAPFRTFKASRPPAPWMTTDIKRLLNRRDRARRRFARTGSAQHFEAFRYARNKAKQAIRTAKLRHTHELFPSNLPIKKFHENIKKIRPKIKEDNVDTDPDALIGFFSSIPQPDQSVVDATCSHYSSVSPPDTPLFEFKEFTYSDLAKHLKKGNPSSMGYDQIPLSFLTIMLDTIAPVILHIFNLSIRQKVFPSLWKKGLIRPIPKVKKPSNPSDYRPISLLCSLSKVLERMVHHQVTTHLNSHNLLHSLQSGFRTGHSTCSALLKVSDDLQRSMDNKMASLLVLFDFSKAFDVVSHRILLSKLRTFGFSENVILWFQSYLCGRHQCVLGAEGKRSRFLPVVSGVPQGSVLGPLLFCLFINDIHSCFRACRFHLYAVIADDLQLYFSFAVTDLPEAVSTVNSDIANLVTWAKKHGLLINTSKTKVLLIASPGIHRNRSLSSACIQVEGNALELVQSARNLGIFINNTMDWSDEVNNVRKKVFGALWSLRRLKKFLSQNTRKLLIKYYVLPLFEYCAPLLNGITQEESLRLQRAQNACVRFIFNVRKWEHITPYFNRLQWLKVENRRKLLTLFMIFKILSTQSPPYLYEKFRFRDSIRTRDTRTHPLMLEKPKCRTESYRSSFLPYAVDLWNLIPYPILNSLSFLAFKTLLLRAVDNGLLSSLNS